MLLLILILSAALVPPLGVAAQGDLAIGPGVGQVRSFESNDHMQMIVEGRKA